MKINIGQKEIIHFIGLGGIGMSGLAQVMRVMGFRVQGSDINVNKNIENCKDLGIKFFQGQKKRNIKNATILVKSSAIKNNNLEIKEAKKRKLPIYERVEMLSNIVSLKKNIIISGSHGKTTTTSLVSKILLESRLDPTIINGGVINSINNNAKLGKGDWAVLEADESDGSFVHIAPTYSIITNIDREHMDYYKSLDDLKRHFIKFVKNVPSFGKTFICIDDKNNREVYRSIKIRNILTYGFNKHSNFKIKNTKYFKDKSLFDIEMSLPNKKKTILKKFEIPLIGSHNIKNATAAIAVSYFIGIPLNILKKSLKNFKGVERRFNKILSFNGAEIYDDYAHHPTEIKELINGVKNSYKEKKIICIFQPHRVSRLNDLKNEFSESFKNANFVILCPVYKAGENIKLNLDYFKFANKIAQKSKVQVFFINNQYDLAKFLKKFLNIQNLVIGMGAGSISAWIKELPKLMKK